MKKNDVLCLSCRRWMPKPRYLVMKLTLILTLGFVLPAFSSGYCQNENISLEVKDMQIEEIIQQLRHTTGYKFLFNHEDIRGAGRKSLQLKGEPISRVMDEVLAGTSLKYKIEEDVIVISLMQQQQTTVASRRITGVVRDLAKNLLPGVTVLIKGTSVGVVTDEKGHFEITLPGDKEMTLVFSFVGMETKEVKVTNQKELHVVMSEDVTHLDEVVITGFNNIKSSSFTGNTVSIKKDDLLKVSKTNVIKAIQSFDPSFRIKENNLWGSDPNAIPEVYIRGESGIASTKQLDRDPLSKSNLVDNPNLPTFIMDGFEISVTKLYDYDPNRIESITILKDAAATALYGSRAANGVVIITTVTPKAGKLNVSYNFVADITAPDLSDYNLLNAEEKLEVERLAGCYLYDPESNYQRDPFKLKEEYNQKLAAVKKGVDTYWLSQPLHSVFNHKHSLYIDGGSENFRFGFDLQYTKEDGVMKESLRDRIGAGFFIQYTYKSLSIRNNTSFLLTKSKESPYGTFSEYAKQLPYNVFKDENGDYLETLQSWGTAAGSTLINPLYEPSLNNFDKSSTEELVNNLSINWKIIPSLLLKGQMSLTRAFDKQERFLDPLSKRNTNELTLTNLLSGELNLNNSKDFTYDMNATLSYNEVINNHMINALAGISVKETVRNSDNAAYRGFPSGALSSPEYAKEQVNKTGFSESRSRLVGFLMSLNYSFKDTYLLDASVRIDGSSAFGSDRRYAPFWSVGAGINLHKYAFVQNWGCVSLLKIRGSFGQTGKVNFPAYAARTSYEIFTDEWFKTGFGTVLKALGNKNLTWETTNTLDVGGELGLFNDRLYIKGAYYDKRTVDLVTDVTVPTSTGFTSYRDNIGEVSNRGFELDVRVHAIRKSDMNLYLNANLAHNKNKILKISESLKAYNDRVLKKFEKATAFDSEVTVPFLQYQEGGSLNSIWGVQSKGINPADGKEIFIKKDGSLANKWVASDQVALGNTDPEVQGSFGINFTYKQFSFFTSFMFECGGQRYNQTLVDKVENVNVYQNNVDKRVLTDRWKQPGDKAQFKALERGREGVEQTRPTSRFVQDYNDLSWSSIELGYDFGRKVTDYLRMSMLRLTVGMSDITHFSNVEQERGLSYPFARTVNFSVKISF